MNTLKLLAVGAILVTGSACTAHRGPVFDNPTVVASDSYKSLVNRPMDLKNFNVGGNNTLGGILTLKENGTVQYILDESTRKKMGFIRSLSGTWKPSGNGFCVNISYRGNPEKCYRVEVNNDIVTFTPKGNGTKVYGFILSQSVDINAYLS